MHTNFMPRASIPLDMGTAPIRGCPSSMGLGSQLGVSPGPVVFACRAGFGVFVPSSSTDAVGANALRSSLRFLWPQCSLAAGFCITSCPETSAPFRSCRHLPLRFVPCPRGWQRGLPKGPFPKNGEVLPLLSAPFPPAAGASPCRDVPGKGNGAVFLHAACNFRRQS